MRRGALVLAALFALAAAGSVRAASFTVNSTADAVDVNPGNGVCETAPGNNVCTLRAAIQEANALAGADTINLPAGTYTLTIAGTGENAAARGDLDVSGNLAITGAGAGSSIIDGNGIDRVFHVLAGASVVVSDVTIRGGSLAGADGGGILNEASLTLNRVVLTSNAARHGGAIYSQGASNSVTLSNVTLNSNTASGDGGAVGMKDTGATLAFTDVIMTGNTAVARGGAYFGDRASGSMTRVTVSGNGSQDGGGLAVFDALANVTLTDVTVSSNTASRRGGGILVDSATATLSRVTVDGNSCTTEEGGGIHVRGGSANLTNVTLSGNTCNAGGGLHMEGGGTTTLLNVTVNGNGGAAGGGGLRRTGGTLRIKNTIIANSTAGGNCSGTITSDGNNLESANTCGLTGPTNLINTNPLLAALQNNGGFTRTHALSPVSPAIDRANATGAPATDQRGALRGADGNGVPNNPVAGDYDIGAFEANATFPATLTKMVAVISDPYNGASNPKYIPGAIAEYTLSVSNPGAAMDNNSVRVTDPVNPNTALFVNDIAGPGSGPVAFQQGTPASGLTYAFGGLASAVDDVEFSNNGGATWTYTPTPGANGCDPAVTHLRVNPKGIFASGLAGADPNFQITFRVCVK